MVNWPDAINGAFELGGSMVVTMSIFQLLRDRRVRGVHWATTAFYSGWGFWNLFFYPSLVQWLSFLGGIAVTLANLVYLALLFRFIYMDRLFNVGRLLCEQCAAENATTRCRNRWMCNPCAYATVNGIELLKEKEL